jgi:hypothetical protein
MKTFIVYNLDTRLPVAVGEGTPAQDVYEIRPHKDRDGFDLISDRLRFGPIWYAGPDAVRYAVAYAKYHSLSRSRRAIIRVLDESEATVCLAKSAGDFRE